MNLKQIDGIYAMKPHQGKPPQAGDAFKTHTYKTDPRFLDVLRGELNHHEYNAEPAAGKRNRPPPPRRIKFPTDNKENPPPDKVYDISPHLRFLGVHFFERESVFYNGTKKQIIIHGTCSFHSRMLHFTDELVHVPKIINLKARIVSVDRSSLGTQDWTLEKVNQSNPKFLANYAVPARSGEKATHGSVLYEEKDPETGKTITGYNYLFEAEPVIGDDSRTLDLRFSVQSKPFGKDKLKIKIDSAITMEDGTPFFTELGHPASGTRTHLLILNADIVLPDGNFYRDRFKPIKE